MNAANLNVEAIVGDIRKRWRRRALVQGAAVTLIVLALGASLLLVSYVTFVLPAAVLTAGVVAVVAVTIGAVVQFMVLPLRHRMTDEQIALFVEERIPELEDRFNSAVEVSHAIPTDREQRALIAKLMEDAARRARTISPATIVDRKRERILSYGATGCVVLVLLLGYASLDELQRIASGVGLSSLPLLKPPMTVVPGDVEIEKGESQEVIVELREETEQPVVLYYRSGAGEWQREEMRKGLTGPAYLFEFVDVQEPVRYYVENGEHRSVEYTVSLYEFPEVSRIDVTYRYPAYTGLAPRVEEGVGDIQGLKGSVATVKVQTTGAVEKAELVLDDGRTVQLESSGNGQFQGSIRLEEPGTYHVLLTDTEDKNNKFPEEHQIIPEEDEAPFITIRDPNQDVRANAIQEVLLAVEVQDDYGVKDVRLRYAINGGEEQTVTLLRPEDARKVEAAGEHLFYLEEYDLEPGDVISYYVEADDYLERPSPEATDMYFIEVIPFDQRFTQVNNMGAAMPGGQPSGVVLSQQQIIAATWKLRREQATMDPAEFDEARRALVQAQANLRDNIQQRVNSTAFAIELQTSQEGRQVTEYLRQAATEMERAILDLQATRLQEALAPERKALNHLLKADALNKDRQVALNRQQQSAGGGAGATEERMTELEDLELDISKDKYEMQAQGAGQGPSPEVDEAMQKLRDLARRQQNLMRQNEQERLRGEDKKRFIDRLQRDQQQLQEQAQNLSRNAQQMARGDRQRQRQIEERMDRVAQNMRQAEQALREGDPQQAMARQQQALNELERLQQDLRLGSGNTREMLDELARNFEQVRNQERQLGRDIQRANEQAEARGGVADTEELRRLQQNRQNVMDNLEDLERQAEALEARARAEDRDLASAARNLVQQMRREELEQEMEDSREALEKGWLDYAARLEEEIQAGMERMETQMRELAGRLPQTDDEKVARSLQDLRDLMQQMEAIREQQERMAQNRQEGPSGGQAGNSQQGRADAARLRRQMDQARETLGRLQQELGGNQQAQRAFAALSNYLGRADHTGVRLEGDAAKAFFDQRIFTPLTQLELELSRQVDALALERKLYNARRGDAPSEYRELVDKYYEALAKQRGR